MLRGSTQCNALVALRAADGDARDAPSCESHFAGYDIRMGRRVIKPVGSRLEPWDLKNTPVDALLTVHPAVLGTALRLIRDEELNDRVRAVMHADPGLTIFNDHVGAPVSAAVARACLAAVVDAAQRAVATSSRQQAASATDSLARGGRRRPLEGADSA